ncbi:hypothetical protein PENTCL1PPCAC_26165, partial [Pristionchus entomophagus]
LRMSGEKTTLQCIMCDKIVEVMKLHSHVHIHFNYYPHKCNDCNVKYIERADLLAHCIKTDHSGSESVDSYKHHQVEEKINDSVFVAKNGMEELLKKKKIPPHPSLSATVPPIISSAAKKTGGVKEVKKEKVEKPSKEEVDESTNSRRSSRRVLNSKTDGIVEPPQKKSKSTKTDEKQPSGVVKKSNKDKKKEEIVDCICGSTEEDGKSMVECDECKVWRHISCLYPVTKQLPNPHLDFFCHKCRMTPSQAREYEDRVKKEREEGRERLHMGRKRMRDTYRLSSKNATVMTRSKSSAKRRK